VHQLFRGFKKAYDSVKREVLYNILLEYGILKKLVRLIKVCLNGTYSSVHIGKLLSDKFHIQNGLKQGDALSSLLFQENQVSLELNGTHQLLAYADNIDLLGGSINTIKENIETLLEACLLACLLACSLAPWCRILFEKLIVTQIFNKYPAFLWNLKVHHHVHKSPPLDPIPSLS
jgi:hypothetical protein